MAAVAAAPLLDALVAVERFAAAAVVAETLLALPGAVPVVGRMWASKAFAAPLYRSGELAVGAAAEFRSWDIAVVLAGVAGYGEALA